jgi:hypothetical protein
LIFHLLTFAELKVCECNALVPLEDVGTVVALKSISVPTITIFAMIKLHLPQKPRSNQNAQFRTSWTLYPPTSPPIVLADDSFPTPPVPGGRLWPKGTWRNRISGEKRDTDSASRLQIIHDLLTRLAEIDSQVDALDDKLTCGLDMLEKSQKVDPTFPLRYLKVEYLQIEMDLSKVTLKEASVASMKGSVKEKVDKIGKKLRSAKAAWAAKLAAAPVSVEKTGVQCSTGSLSPHDIARLSMQCF